MIASLFACRCGRRLVARVFDVYPGGVMQVRVAPYCVVCDSTPIRKDVRP